MNINGLQRLPALRDVRSTPEAIQLVITKLKLCEKRFDFTNPRASIFHKEAKRRTLVEIIDFLNSNKEIFGDERIYQPIIDMVSANLFRALPVGTSEDEFFDPEDDEPHLELAWPHIQIVYELLRRFIVSSETDPKILKKYITHQFILGLLDLFDSEDPREREYLKTVLHRLYGKVMPFRPFIRKSIMNVFHRFVYEVHRHNGVAELLEILGSIINGFAVPLKDEHKDFLRKSLIPLHTPKSLPSYHVQLSFCVTQFVEKEPSLAVDVIQGLIRYWPITQSRKEVMFLNELEEILELTRPEEFAQIIKPFFLQISKCIESPHFQVAERALFFWNNEYIVNLIVQFKKEAVPLVYAALRRNAESHWNSNVQSLSFNVQKLLSEMDSVLYDMCADNYEDMLRRKQISRRAMDNKWKLLEKFAELKLAAQVSSDPEQKAKLEDLLANGEESASGELFNLTDLQKFLSENTNSRYSEMATKSDNDSRPDSQQSDQMSESQQTESTYSEQFTRKTGYNSNENNDSGKGIKRRVS